MSRNRTVGLRALLPGRYCPLNATIFYAATKDRITGERMQTSKINPASYLLGALAVCDEHRAEVLKSFNILQGLTIKQDSLALLPRDVC